MHFYWVTVYIQKKSPLFTDLSSATPLTHTTTTLCHSLLLTTFKASIFNTTENCSFLALQFVNNFV